MGTKGGVSTAGKPGWPWGPLLPRSAYCWWHQLLATAGLLGAPLQPQLLQLLLPSLQLLVHALLEMLHLQRGKSRGWVADPSPEVGVGMGMVLPGRGHAGAGPARRGCWNGRSAACPGSAGGHGAAAWLTESPGVQSSSAASSAARVQSPPQPWQAWLGERNPSAGPPPHH